MVDELFKIIESASPSHFGLERSTIDLSVHVQPGAGRSVVVGRRRDALHVRVAPPPRDGRANVAVEVLIADLFDVARANVSVIAGDKRRDKRVRVEGVVLGQVRSQLEDATTPPPRGAAPSRERFQKKY
ncbi:MAG: DUF167 domain-containing protein [Gaiellaceae bacterium]